MLAISLRAILLLLLPSLASAQAPVKFVMHTSQAAPARVSLVRWDDQGLLVETGGAQKKYSRFIELHQENRPLPAILTRNFVLLTNGDRVPLDPESAASLEAQRLHVWPAASLSTWRAKGLELFAPNVVLLFWSVPEGADDADLFFAGLAQESRKQDAVFLKNGDRIDGTLASIKAKGGCTIVTSRKKFEVPWSQLAGVAWNTDRQARLRSKGRYYRAIINGGGRVNLSDLRFEEETRRWVGKTQFGASVELPEASLLAIDVRQDQAVDLSDLTPRAYEPRPYLGAVWPLGKDCGPDGAPLRLAGSAFEKGLGLHAPCRVSYSLEGKYQRFDALVGIDEFTSRRGRAKAAVEIDGKRIDLFAGKEFTCQTHPAEIRLDLRNAQTLTLIVDVGSFGDVQANVNWAKAWLVKKD